MYLKRPQYILFLCILLGAGIVAVAVPSTVRTKSVKSVLVLHSYHQGMQWTDSISKGVQEVLKPQEEEIDIFYEYLDSKRNLDSSYAEQKKIFHRKYKDHSSFDVIICVDDNALDFLVQNRDTLFAKMPVVFCGINKPLTDQLLEDSLITGVAETPAIKETFELILRLHPTLGKVHVVNDIYAATAKINRKRMQWLDAKFPDKIQYLDSLSSQELAVKVEAVPQGDVVLLLTFNQDKNKNFISYKEERRIVLGNAQVPVYAVWDFFLGKGVIGGKIMQGKMQGQLAAQMALQILRGVPILQLPIITDSQSSYIFDEEQLKRFGIAEERLPAQSLIINKPASFYKLDRVVLFWVLGIFILLVLVVLALARLIRKKKEAELALLEKQRYLKMTLSQHHLISSIVTFLNSTNDLAFVMDDVLNTITASSHADKVFILSLKEGNAIDADIGLRYAKKGRAVEGKSKEDWSFRMHKLLRAVLDKKMLVSNDLQNFSGKERQFLEGEEMEALILLPVEVKGKVNAMAGFAFSEPHKWTASEISLFSTLARVIANAWERNFQMNQYLNMEKQHSEAVHVMERTSRLTSIGVLTAGITHEINQPLNAIKINTGMLLRQQAQQGEKTPLLKKLKAINKGINRIDRIILQMKNYWIRPVDEGEIPIWVDLNKAVQRSCSLVERHLEKEQILLKIQPTTSQLLIQGNKIQVEQIIINLLMNAIQALKKKNKNERIIYVKTFKQWSSSQLVVEDNGTGIDESIGERLFDPFFSTKEKEEGSGLGLAIVKTFVTRMQGHIRYENRYEGGVRFVVDFKSLEDKKVTLTPDF